MEEPIDRSAELAVRSPSTYDQLLKKGYRMRPLKKWIAYVRSLCKNPAPRDPFKQYPADIQKVVGELRVDPSYMTSNYMLKQHSRANYLGITPNMAEFTQALMLRLKAEGMPCYVHTAYRSPQLQQKLYADGFSSVRSGPHQRGAAVDIVHAHLHWNAPPEFWRYMGIIGKQIARDRSLPVVWGGDWKGLPDPAHWQLKDWRQASVVLLDPDVVPETSMPFSLVKKYA
jgi:hypothetical protein